MGTSFGVAGFATGVFFFDAADLAGVLGFGGSVTFGGARFTTEFQMIIHSKQLFCNTCLLYFCIKAKLSASFTQ